MYRVQDGEEIYNTSQPPTETWRFGSPSLQLSQKFQRTMALLRSVVAVSLVVAAALGRDVPPNVVALYNSIRSAGSCKDALATGFYSADDGSPGAFDGAVKDVQTLWDTDT